MPSPEAIQILLSFPSLRYENIADCFNQYKGGIAYNAPDTVALQESFKVGLLYTGSVDTHEYDCITHVTHTSSSSKWHHDLYNLAQK